VTVTVPATADPAQQEFALWVIPTGAAQPTYLTSTGAASVTVYSAGATATVGVESGGELELSDPNAATATDFTFGRG
ncbi:hypothetical protein, partial [Streptococcus pneumoniae]|uniref:hypothetical protein n=1 Tax=Streptococcus pneumoniae TaxID=1313 RepID=UPI0018B0D9F4